MWQRCFVAAAGLTLAALVGPAYAQRAAENAVNSAEDAFGVSIGNESIGLYSATSARGFNPQQAGNIRADGLYWDQQGNAQGRTYPSTTIRVGLSAQSYPFPAPTGIVDIRLPRPGDHLGGSASLSFGPYSSAQFEGEVSGPIVPGKLGGFATVTVGNTVTDARFDFRTLLIGALFRWTPSDNVDITIFDQGHFARGKLAPFTFTAGGAVPPEYDRTVYFGQEWAKRTRHVNHLGVLMTARVWDDWLLRTGFFRSQLTLSNDYFVFIRNVQPNGFGTMDATRAPGSRDRSYSGEARLSRTFTEGPRQHTLHFAVRGRKTDRIFGGGSNVVPLGISQIGVDNQLPEPSFNMTPPSLDNIAQVTPGVSYVGRWRDLGEFSVGAQKSFYDREVNQPGLPQAKTKSQPWLYNGTLAIYLGKNAALYSSYTRGLEESGLAPETAANRGEAMPASLTQQVDAGVRYKPSASITLLAGVFEVKKPFFERNAANIYTEVGDLSHRGVELSLSGRLAPGLTVVAGAMLLRARVEADAAVASFIAPVPVGKPNRTVRLNVQYGPASWRGFSVDGLVSQDGPAYANRANTVRLRANTTVDLGARYNFKILDSSASLRVRVQNVMDSYGWSVSSSGAYSASGVRRYTAQLISDF